MMTREEILSIDRYCEEHGMSMGSYFNTHPEVHRWAYYRYKQRYREEDEQSLSPAGFVQLTPSGEFVSGAMSPIRPVVKDKAPTQGVIGHLKSGHRMMRNYLKGVLGDAINTMMAAAAFNMRHWMNKHAMPSFVSILLTMVRGLRNVLSEKGNQYVSQHPILAAVAK